MRINVLSTIIVTFIFFFCSCQTTKKTSSVHSGQNNSYVVASLKKTACYGKCPVYELAINSDLTVKMKGEKNIEWLGNYSSSITAQQLKTIQDSFQEAKFFEFEDEYSSNVSDLPTTFVYYSDGKKVKTIKDYTGAPESLRELEKILEELVQTLEWEEDKS